MRKMNPGKELKIVKIEKIACSGCEKAVSRCRHCKNIFGIDDHVECRMCGHFCSVKCMFDYLKEKREAYCDVKDCYNEATVYIVEENKTDYQSDILLRCDEHKLVETT